MSQQPFNSDSGFSTTGNVTATNLVTAGTGGNITLSGGDITGANVVSANTYNSVGNIKINAGGNTIAIGYSAGQTTQGEAAVTLGAFAGSNTQGAVSVAIGFNAGQTIQGSNAVSVGAFAGQVNQSDSAVAIGRAAGNDGQSLNSIAIGRLAASINQGETSVAIGFVAGNTAQGGNSVAIGRGAGQLTQGEYSIAMGFVAGNTNQSNNTVAIGRAAGQTDQGDSAVAIGRIAGNTSQGANTVAVGRGAGQDLQGNAAVAVGAFSGNNNQGGNTVAIGYYAGHDTQGISSVAIGDNAGYLTQGNSAVAIGTSAGSNTQGQQSVAIGLNAGSNAQGDYAVAVGLYAGSNTQGYGAVAIGEAAGDDTQGIDAVAIGDSAGQTTQGTQAVAIGIVAGQTNQGNKSVAIGAFAGQTDQANNSIIINATGAALNQTTPSTFTVKPIRNAAGASALYYDAGSGEITYDTAGSITTLSNGTSNVSIPITDGNVIVGFGGSDTFTFGTDGNLTLLHGGKIAEVASPVPGNYALALSGTGVTDPDQQLLVYPTSLDANHLHLTSGNLYNTELFLGNDNLYVKLANTGNVVVNSDNSAGNTAQWTFGSDGYLILPIGATISNFANTVSLNAEGNTKYAQLYWNGNIGNGNPYNGSDLYTWAYVDDTGFNIQYKNANTSINKNWRFRSNGNLTAQGDIITTGNVSANNISLVKGQIQSGLTSVVNDDINSISLGTTTTIDVFGSPFAIITRGTLTISGCTTTTEANGEWYYQSINSNTFVLYADSTYTTLVDSTTWTPYTVQDGLVAIIENLPAGNIVINANGFLSTFGTDGNLTAPGNISATGNITSGNISTGKITLVNGAVIHDTAGNAVAFGLAAGANTQGASAVAIGVDAGQNNQGFISIAIGAGAGANGQSQAAVAIGTDTGANIQGIEAIAIGFKAANQNQGQQSIAIGKKAGYNNQGNNSIILNATGDALDQTTANTFTVAPVRNDTSNVTNALYYNTTTAEISYGPAGGGTDWANIGNINNANGPSNITIGQYSGANTQGSNAIAIGSFAGQITQSTEAIAIGGLAGNNMQGESSVAIGRVAGNDTQGNSAVAIGDGAGADHQGQWAVAVGAGAGLTTQGANSVGIGLNAGGYQQGTNAVAIGSGAGSAFQANNSIILNASGTSLEQTTANTFTVKPIRSATGTTALYYDADSGEITYDTPGAVLASSIANGSSSVGIPTNSGNVTIAANSSSTWTFDTTGNLTFPSGNLVIITNDVTFSNAAVISSVNNLVTFSTGVNGGLSSLWVEDLANIGTSNIAAVYANPTAGSGNVRIAVGTNGGAGPNLWDFIRSGALKSPVVAYANLTAVDGGRAFINNANLVATGNFGAQVSGGGSNTVPVWSDGSNWYIG